MMAEENTSITISAAKNNSKTPATMRPYMSSLVIVCLRNTKPSRNIQNIPAQSTLVSTTISDTRKRAVESVCRTSLDSRRRQAAEGVGFVLGRQESAGLGKHRGTGHERGGWRLGG